MPEPWLSRDENGRLVIDIDAAFDACDAERDAREDQVIAELRRVVDVVPVEVTDGE